MEACLFVGHGSRDPEGNAQLLDFTSRVGRFLSFPIVETCFLELTEPDIPEGIRRCVEKGAKRITVVPIMLLFAGHAKVHIPFPIREAARRYPDVTFTYGRPVGVDQSVVSILERRVRSVTDLPQDRNESDTAVLVVGRGSSDAEANSDLFKIARLLWERLPVRWVETAFVGVTDPGWEEGVERCVRLGAKNIIILPYLLFTGVLIKRMNGRLDDLRKRYAGVHLSMTDYLGLDDGLVGVMMNRLLEAAGGQGLDWEQLVSVAEANGHHLHHHNHDHHHHPHESAVDQPS
ncbi:cobalamin biosynthesis protein CbiX [Polycladomyces abyssicola]|uniref:Cobalamin biosynthesis protein CbiX n=1 Tax=Polycladomyces abyssicola TaxID=1125966 RepID=A0A8D5UDU5_9BACL|nr:sirohydrochlorin chelatase [Polycladomyces abyssicola]BCU80514.1 cobalamin biosynthesis protein CbiX [Polycladomyces abyssicola]